MPKYNYALPGGAVSEEQTQYLSDAFHKSVDVLFAPFGDLSKLEDLRDHAGKIDEVFGEGATEASVDINTSGDRHFDGVCREILTLIHYVRQMAESTDFWSFNDAHERFDNAVQLVTI